MQIFWYLYNLNFETDNYITEDNIKNIKNSFAFEKDDELKTTIIFKIQSDDFKFKVSISQLLFIIFEDITFYTNESLNLKLHIDSGYFRDDLHHCNFFLNVNLTHLQYSLNSIITLINQNMLTYDTYNPFNTNELKYNFFNSKIYDNYSVCIQKYYFTIAKLHLSNNTLQDQQYELTKAGFFFAKKFEPIKFHYLLTLMEILKDEEYFEKFLDTQFKIYEFILEGLFYDERVELFGIKESKKNVVLFLLYKK